ncbi:hypothetical protein [Thalassobacillus devorans]|uniref:hypothetical protein n=1 Tax=Thalassobacillus devorans TaxID=279813 RepID=UPI00048A84D6|nr:hypothetical protein [Thalassobacillus devorans]
MEIIKLEENHWKLLKNKYNYPANVTWNQEEMLANGYLIQEGQMLLGSYLLQPVGENVVQLKQLTLFNQATPELLLVIFQTIVEDIHQSTISTVIVNSHSEQLDTLLEHFDFIQMESEKLPTNDQLSTEKAWVYQVN